MFSDLKYSSDNINYKSISCENIPELFLDKIVAKTHFSKFGKINKFILKPNRLQCTIDYEREEDAEAALLNGGSFNGVDFNITYTQDEVANVRNTEEWVDPDIQSELEAMGNASQKRYRSFLFGSSFTAKTQQLSTRFSKTFVKSRIGNQMNINSSGALNIETQNFENSSQNLLLKHELENIMKKQALSAVEKCVILDARDKYIRLITKSADINIAVSTKGTCPDMCPEKERLLRETRDQISSFEISDDGKFMNHKLAVKEYSRSSADQEAPLAHELRSESVLKMTMTYLLHRVMHLCDRNDINIGDWFHFLWDRTRSIRKDITQQELCSVGVVELIEQCARFHIHCAARLIAEEPSVFDQKINTENLTKCLQSLKYMYHDLRIKKIKCCNEAEFRAYIILLNLNNANFLWEVKQLPDEVRKSKDIREAIEFFLSIENNNFVKFFKLIRKTSYMNSCVLMRYFNQVRITAVKTMVKAYTSPRQNTITMPLSYLTEILAFESSEDTITFFEHYGMECDYKKVSLEKNWNYIPDVPLKLDRYLEIIESKRFVSIGESICGKPLLPESVFDNHVPHNSFDDNGHLKQNAWTADDQKNLNFSTNKRVLTPCSDKTFKVPKISPPILPRQKQQNQHKSMCGSTPKSVISESNKEDVSSEEKSVVKSSIFESNRLSPLSTKTSIFGFSKLDNIKNGQSSSFISGTSNTELIVGNLFKQSNDVTSPSGVTGQLFSKSDSQSIFGTSFKEEKQSTSIFKMVKETQTKTNENKELFKTTDTEANSLDSKPASPYNQSSYLEFGKSIKSSRETIMTSDRDKTELSLFFEKIKKNFGNIENHSSLQKDNKIEDKVIRNVTKTREISIKKLIDKREDKSYFKKFVEIKSDLILDELIREVQDEMISSMVEKMFLKLKRNQIIELNAWNILQNLCNDVIADSLKEITQEELNLFVKNQNLLKKYFAKWHVSAIKSTERRYLIQKTRNWALPESIDTVAKRIAHPTQNINFEMMYRYRLGISKSFERISSSYAVSRKINVFNILKNELNNNVVRTYSNGQIKSKNYLKIIFSMPDHKSEIKNFNYYLNSFLNEAIQRKNPCNAAAFICETDSDLAICIHNISGHTLGTDQRSQYMNGLVFFCTLVDPQNSLDRLLNIFKNSKNNRSIPLSIIVYKTYNDDNNNEIQNILQLKELQQSGKVLSFKIFEVNDYSLQFGVEAAISYVGQNINHINDLEMQSSISFLQSTIAEEIWERFHDSWQINPLFQVHCTKPENVVNLYNTALNKIKSLFKEDLSNFSEFPAELYQFVSISPADFPKELEHFPEDWKNELRNINIAKFLDKLRLKNITGKWPTKIEELEKKILSYARECLPISLNSWQRAGYCAIKKLLENLRDLHIKNLPFEDQINNISWLNIIRPISLEILKENWKTEKLPNEFIYLKQKHQEFLSKPWWLEELKSKQIQIEEQMEEKNISENDYSEAEIIYNTVAINSILDKSSILLERANENIAKYHSFINKNREITQNFITSLHELETKNYTSYFINPKRHKLDKNFSSPKVKKFKKNIENCKNKEIDTISRANRVIEKMDMNKMCDFS